MKKYILNPGIFFTLFFMLDSNRAAAQYCAAGGPACGAAGNSWITNVSVNSGGFSNNSVCGTNGYTNFTGLSVTLVRNSNYTITVAESGIWPADAVLVWIDWDHSNIFEAGERFALPGQAAGVFAGPIVIPAAALSGPTRMRLRMFDASAQNPGYVNPCGSTAYGEVEDYTINLAAVLPLKLISFDATVINKSFAGLSWTAEQTETFSGFEIQRCNDSRNWQKVDFVDAKIGAERQQYQWTDPLHGKGILQYRLKIIYPSGNFSYSNIRSVKLDGETGMMIAPNPAREMANINLHVDKKGIVQVQLMNLTGRLLYTKTVSVFDGNNNIKIPIQQSWPAGTYVVKVATGTKNYISKLEILK